MAFRRGPALMLIAPLLALAGGSARAQEHCSGTLCDFYYGSSASAEGSAGTAPAAAPKPMTVPSNPLSNWFGNNSSDTQQAATAPAGQQPSGAASSGGNGFFHMGGGGVMNRNATSECGGTLCDLYHGHASSDDSETSTVQDINGTPASHYDSGARSSAPEAMASAVAAPAAPAVAEEPSRPVAPLPKRAATCAPGKDPWSCYRH